MNFNDFVPFQSNMRKSKDGTVYYVDKVCESDMKVRNSKTGKTEIVTRDEYEQKYQKFN